MTRTRPSVPSFNKPTPAEKPDDKVAALEALLASLTVQHEELLALAERHKAAIMTANVLEMHEIIAEQNEAVQRIAELEKARAALVAAMGFAPTPSSASMTRGKAPTPAPAAPVTLTAIASTLAEPARSRLSVTARKLRSLIEQLGREQQTIQMAAEAVATHLDGIMTQVAQRLSSAGTYARGGMLDRRAPMASTFDVRT